MPAAAEPLRIDDALIRAALCRQLLTSHDGKLVAEWNIGSCRIDLARIEPALLHGIEIKSPCDTLNRLSLQAHEYGRVFDVCTLVVGRAHVAKAAMLIPEWWQIIEVVPTGKIGQGGEIMLLDRRKPGINPDVDADCLARLLWCSELRAILTAAKLITLRREAKWRMIGIATKNLTLAQLRPLVIRALLARTDWRRDVISEQAQTIG